MSGPKVGRISENDRKFLNDFHMDYYDFSNWSDDDYIFSFEMLTILNNFWSQHFFYYAVNSITEVLITCT